jgi:hypothetical protein
VPQLAKDKWVIVIDHRGLIQPVAVSDTCLTFDPVLRHPETVFCLLAFYSPKSFGGKEET